MQTVDPFLGVDNGGNVTPGAQVPFGFVSLGPDTTYADTNGYNSRGQIVGFSHTHVSGTGGQSKYGNFSVLPAVGDPDLNHLQMTKEAEVASPGYYAVTLHDPGRPQEMVRAELTATRMTGTSRFTFPANAPAVVVFDASAHIRLGGNSPVMPDGTPDQQQTVTSTQISILDDRHFEGSASFMGGWNPAPYTLYFFAEFSRPVQHWDTWYANPLAALSSNLRQRRGCSKGSSYRCRLGILAHFDSAVSRQVELHVAVSFVSSARAREHLLKEAGGSFFDDLHLAARQQWEQVLAHIRVEGGTPEQRSIFYSLLYRAHTMPHDVSGDNAWWVSQEPHYEDFYCLWDTFRTLNPLLTLIEPERQRGIVRSLIDTYAHTGWLPDGRVAGSNGLTQGGSHADVVIADAVVKHLGGFDQELAYRAIRKDATVSSPHPLLQGRSLEAYSRLGYLPLGEQRSASRTVEYAYDDFAVAEVARELGHNADASFFLKRSHAWHNLWDKESRCIRPRYADGRWMGDFDCTHEYGDGTVSWWDSPFYEGRPWQYSTFVPQDTQGLMQVVGGKDAFVSWLDALFDGGFYTQGNEPDFLAPYLYIDAGRPDKTADRVAHILDREYSTGRAGLPGNDDSGALSSWYLWSSMGLFPNAGQPWYYITVPRFSRVEIHLEGDRTFIIAANASGPASGRRYIQSVTLNGQPLHRACITHDELEAGGELRIQLGADPGAWGALEAPSALLR